MHHVLLICGKNRLRSPTAEHAFADWERIETSSAGINRDADSVELLLAKVSKHLPPRR